LPQDGSEQAREPPPLGEVHVDNDLGQKAESRSCAHSAADRVIVTRVAIAAQNHRGPHRGRTRARPCDHQFVVRRAASQHAVRPRSHQHPEAGLVSSTEESSGGPDQFGEGPFIVSLLSAGQSQLADDRDAEPVKCGRISCEGPARNT
jgi:hypothetical protein